MVRVAKPMGADPARARNFAEIFVITLHLAP